MSDLALTPEQAALLNALLQAHAVFLRSEIHYNTTGEHYSGLLEDAEQFQTAKQRFLAAFPATTPNPSGTPTVCPDCHEWTTSRAHRDTCAHMERT
jgi:hypothetical protein